MSTTKIIAFRFIFYSLVTVLLIAVGTYLHPEENKLFCQSLALWREPVIAGLLCGLLAALLGIYILLNRIVFISLAIAQGASLGIFLAFFGAALLGAAVSETFSLLSGLAFAALSMLIFAWLRKSRQVPDESLIGLLYVIASGLTILIGDRVSEGHHSIDNLIFGNAVAVTPQELQSLAIVTLPLLLLHFFFRREFIYASADHEFMRIKGLAAKFWIVLLYFTLTLGITINLKVLGSLPVFALMLIPPFIALKRTRGLRESFVISLLIGMLIPVLGYYYSFLFSFPTGAAVILVGVFYLLASWGEKWFRI